MDNVIRFPKEKTRISEIEYDLETVQIVAEALGDIIRSPKNADPLKAIHKIFLNPLKGA